MKKIAAKRQREYRLMRRRDIAIAIDDTWSSLRSHLAHAVEAGDAYGNERFQSGCVHEYARTLHVLARELDELAKIDFREVFTVMVEPL
jgi:hypothetical protein